MIALHVKGAQVKKYHYNWKNPLSNLNQTGHIPLKVPNVQFDFDACVSNCMLSTHTSKSNSALGSKLWVLLIACKWGVRFSMYVSGAACCQQIQIHRKLNTELNFTFGTFSGICPRPSNLLIDLEETESIISAWTSRVFRRQHFSVINRCTTMEPFR